MLAASVPAPLQVTFNAATGHTYYLMPQAKRSTAAEWAAQMGGQLAQVHDATENEWLRSTFTAPRKIDVWLGLNDTMTEGAYRWAHNVPLGSYRPWAANQPNDASNPETEDFALLTAEGTWFDQGDYNTRTTAGVTTKIHGLIEVRPATISLTAPDPKAQEAKSSGHITLVRTGNTVAPLTVRLRSFGSAVNGGDYTSIPTEITFAAGETTRSFAVNPVSGDALEVDEVASFELVSQPAYTVDAAKKSANVTILDAASVPYTPNDAGFYTLTITPISDAATEGAGDRISLLISRHGGVNDEVAGRFTLRPGLGTDSAENFLAQIGSEGNVSGGSLIAGTGGYEVSFTLAEGRDSTVVHLTPTDDGTVEVGKYWVAALQPGANYKVDAAYASVPVLFEDNDIAEYAPVGSPTAIKDATVNDTIVSISRRADGQFAVLWRDNDVVAPKTAHYVQWFDATGKYVWRSFQPLFEETDGVAIDAAEIHFGDDGTTTIGFVGTTTELSASGPGEYRIGLIRMTESDGTVHSSGTLPAYHGGRVALAVSPGGKSAVIAASMVRRGAAPGIDSFGPNRSAIWKLHGLFASPASSATFVNLPTQFNASDPWAGSPPAFSAAFDVFDRLLIAHSHYDDRWEAAPAGTIPRWRYVGRGTDGFGQLFDSAGNLLINAFGLNASDTTNVNDPLLRWVPGSGDEFVLASDGVLRTLKLTGVGAVVGTPVALRPENVYGRLRSLDLTADGSVLSVWGGSGGPLDMRRTTINGGQVGPAQQLSAAAASGGAVFGPSGDVFALFNTPGSTTGLPILQRFTNRRLLSLRAPDAAMAEVGNNGATLLFDRRGDLSQLTRVAVSISGSAAEGLDYDLLPEFVTFNPGQTLVRWPINALDDTISEGPETAAVALGSVLEGTGYSLGEPKAATLTLADNEPPPPPPVNVSLAVPDATAREAGPDGATFIVSRVGSTTQALTIPFAFTGSAAWGKDFTVKVNGVTAAVGTATLTLPAGASSISVGVTPVNDTTEEGTEAITLTLAAGAGYTLDNANATKTATLVDNEVPTIRVSAIDGFANEQGVATGRLLFERVGFGETPVTIFINTTGSTGAPTSDFVGLPTSVTIPANKSSVELVVKPVDDTVAEVDKFVRVNIAAGGGYKPDAQDATARVNLIDNDRPVLGVSVSSATASEGTGVIRTFTFTRSGGSAAAALTVPLALGGSASKTDYTGLVPSITFAAGQRSAAMTVTVVNDTLPEADETVLVGLVAGTRWTLDPAKTRAKLTILANDGNAVGVEAVDDLARENTLDTGRLRIYRVGSTAAALSVNLQFDGEAAPGIDYTALNPVVVIPAGKSEVLIDVKTLTDAIVEPDETVVARIMPGPYGVIGSNASAALVLLEATPVKVTSLSATTAAPTEILTVNGEFIAGSTYAVRFSGPGGFVIDMPAVSVTANAITVAVPPFINKSTGKWERGTLSVSVSAGTKSAPVVSNAIAGFVIQGPPVVTAPAGSVTMAVLIARRNGLQRALEQSKNNGQASAAQISGLTEQLARVDACVLDIQKLIDGRVSSLNLGTVADITPEIKKADLATMDNAMVTLIDSVARQSGGIAAAAELTGLAKNWNNGPGYGQSAMNEAASKMLRYREMSNALDATRRAGAIFNGTGALLTAAGVAASLYVGATAGTVLLTASTFVSLAWIAVQYTGAAVVWATAGSIEAEGQEDEQNRDAYARELMGGALKDIGLELWGRVRSPRVGTPLSFWTSHTTDFGLEVVGLSGKIVDWVDDTISAIQYVSRAQVDLILADGIATEPGIVLTGLIAPVADTGTIYIHRYDAFGYDESEYVNLVFSGTGITAADFDPMIGFSDENPLQVEIPAGQRFVAIDFVALADSLEEGDEKLKVELQPTGDTKGGGSREITLKDLTVGVAFVDGDLKEPGHGGLIRFTRSTGTKAALLVKYSLGGSSTSGVDYVGVDGKALPGTVIIPTGQTSVDVPIRVLSDSIAESDESLSVTVSPDAIYAVNSKSASTSTTIQDARVWLTASGDVREGGRTRFVFHRSGDLSMPLRVNYTSTGSAVSGKDHSVPALGAVTIPAGSDFVELNVDAYDDTAEEDTEDLRVEILSVAQGTAIDSSRASAGLKLLDNDLNLSNYFVRATFTWGSGIGDIDAGVRFLGSTAGFRATGGSNASYLDYTSGDVRDENSTGASEYLTIDAFKAYADGKWNGSVKIELFNWWFNRLSTQKATVGVKVEIVRRSNNEVVNQRGFWSIAYGGTNFPSTVSGTVTLNYNGQDRPTLS